MMTANFENDLLFDDATTLQDQLGAGCLNTTSLTNDCDCSGYTLVQDDEDTHPSEGS